MGSLGPAWRRGEVAAGSVVFVGAVGYADDPADLFAAPSDQASVHKVLLVIHGGRPVELSMRHPDAAFFYDESGWGERNVVPFRLGGARVRFEPCGGDQRWTQFNGGFLIARSGMRPGRGSRRWRRAGLRDARSGPATAGEHRVPSLWQRPGAIAALGPVPS
jgi:hypothetical protein